MRPCRLGFPEFIVQAVPERSVGVGERSLLADGVIDDAASALLAAIVGVLDAAAFECAAIPLLHLGPVDRDALARA